MMIKTNSDTPMEEIYIFPMTNIRTYTPNVSEISWENKNSFRFIATEAHNGIRN